METKKLAAIAQLVQHQALGHEVVWLNLPAILQVALGGYCSSSLTISGCNNWYQALVGKFRADSGDYYIQARTLNDGTTLAL